MHRKFASTAASLTATLTFAFGAYALWGAVVGEPSVSWFTALTSQRDVAYAAGLTLPVSALVAGLLVTRQTTSRPFSGFGTGFLVAATAFALMAFIAPLTEALIMRLALPARGLAYESQGWSHWWRLYSAGLDAVGQSLGVSGAEARPFWRAAGLSAWQPVYVAAAALITTVLGLSTAGRMAGSEREQQRRLQLLIPALVAGLLFSGWKVGRILALRFDVPPESSLALMLVGPALLLCGMLLNDLSRGRAVSR